MANNRSITDRRPTFLIDDILSAKDYEATHQCGTSRTKTEEESGGCLKSSDGDARECDVERRRTEKLDSRLSRSEAKSVEVTSPISTGHSSQPMRDVISLSATKSSEGGVFHRSRVMTLNDSHNDHRLSAENLVKGDLTEKTNSKETDGDDYDVSISRMTSGEFKSETVTDSHQSRGKSTDDNHILKLLSAVGYSSTSRLGGNTNCDGFASTAAAAGTLYRLCHMHLADNQQLQRRPHHQSTAVPLLADRPQLAVDNRFEQHHGHEHWTSSLRRAILHASIDTEVSRTACLDRQNSPYLYRQNTPLASHISFPLLNYARSGGGVLSADVGGGRLPTVAATGGAGIPDGEFLRMKCRRNRTVFTEYHLTSLEKNFDRQKYLSTKDRAQLAARLGLSQIQVKTWYQNRRMKWKKQVLQQGGTHPPTKPKGRPRKHEDELNANQQLVGDRMDAI